MTEQDRKEFENIAHGTALDITPEQQHEYESNPPDAQPINEAQLAQRLYQLMSRYPGYHTDDTNDRLGLAQLIAGHLALHCEVSLKPIDVFLERLRSARQLTRKGKGKPHE
jgi:hypothetical protein